MKPLLESKSEIGVIVKIQLKNKKSPPNFKLELRSKIKIGFEIGVVIDDKK